MRVVLSGPRRRPSQGLFHVDNAPKAGAGVGGVWVGTFSLAELGIRDRAGGLLRVMKHMSTHTQGPQLGRDLLGGESKGLGGPSQSNSGWILGV